MIIPKTIKIGSHVFTIESKPNLISDRDRYAEVNYRTNEITIDPSATKQQVEESLIHEIIEIIDGHCEMRLSHQTIKTLGFSFYQVLQDNNLLRE